MSREIDERVVQMQFDNRDFENRVQSTLSDLNRLNRGLDMTESARGFESLGSAMNDLNLNPLINGVRAVHEKFSALEIMAITALQNITNSAVNAGKRLAHSLTIEPIKQGFDEYELKMRSVQTIMASTGEDLDTIMGKLNELNVYADKTIYSFSDMTSNIGKFTNAGVNLTDAVDAIQGVANVAAVSGANANEASRAMYNFAQALSAGYIRLIDWKSIENANMATVEFKTNLLEAAVAAGTVARTADGMYRVLTTNINGKTMQGAINATRNFNDSLAHQWMTTEVLTNTLGAYATDIRDMTKAEVAAYEAKLKARGYTEAQIEAMEQLGIKAANAATEVKTFTQLLDTLKEAVGSGWAETWEIVFGDFEEAKKLWTGVSNAIGGVIDKQSKARNALLGGGLSSGWKQLMDEGIESTSTFKEEVTQVAREHGIAIDEMIQKTGSFEESLKEGWLTADMMAESLQNLTDMTAGLSREQLEEMGLTEDQAAAFANLNSRVKDGTLNLEEYAEKMGHISGRENIIETFRNGWEALSAVVSAVREAFQDVFHPATAEQLYSMTEAVRNVSEKFKDAVQTMVGLDNESSGFKDTLRGLFAVFDLVAQAVSAVFGGITQLLAPMGSLVNSVLGVTGGFGDWLYSLDQTVRATGIFKSAVQGVVNFLQAAASGIHTVFQSITGLAFSDALSSIAEKLQSFRAVIRNFINGLKSDSDEAKPATDKIEKAFSPLGTLFDGLKRLFNGMVRVFKSLIPVFANIATGVGEAVGTIGDRLSEMFANADFSKIFDIVNGGVLASLGLSLKGLIDNLRGLSHIGGVDGFRDLLNPLRETLETYQSSLKADALLKIAGAIGVLAASVLVLSTIDTETLGQSVVALGALFGALVGAMVLLNKGLAVAGSGEDAASGGQSTLAQFSAKLIVMGTVLDLIAGAVVVLAGAMKILSTLNPVQIVQGLVSVGVLLGELVAFLKFADFDGLSVTRGLGLVLLATSLNLIALTVKKIGSMDIAAMIQGLTGLGVVMAELVAFLKFADLSGTGIGQGVGLLLIAAGLNTISSAVAKIGGLDIDALAKGLTGLTVVLGEIGVFAAVMGATGAGNVAAVGAGLLVMSSGITVLAVALKILASINLAEMAVATAGLGAALLELGLAVTAMQGALAGAAALTTVALAVAILAPALKLLGTMRLSDVGVSLLALAGAFTILGLAATVLGPLTPALLGLGGAVALVGVGMLACAAAAELFALALGTLAVTGGAGIGVLVAALAGLIGLIPEMITAIGAGVVKALAGFASSIPALVTGLGAIITALCQAIIECTPMLMKTITVLLDAAIRLLYVYLPTIVAAAVEITVAILNGLSAQMPVVIDAAINLVISFIEGLAKGIDNNIERATLACFNLGRALLNVFLAVFGIHINAPSAETMEQGNLLVRGLIDGIGKKMKEAKEKIHELGQAMIDRFKQFKDDFAAAAQHVIGGLVSGVKNGLSSAVNAVKNIGSSMIGGLKKVLGIASPSREMAILGRYSTEGFANGLLDRAALVADAAGKLGGAALDSLTTAFGSIGTGFEDFFPEDPVICPVLDLSSVNSGMNQFDSLFHTQRTMSLAFDASAEMAAAAQTNQNGLFMGVVTRLDRQMASLEASVDRLIKFADTNMGTSVGLAVRQALNGTSVSMNGRQVGELVTEFQDGMERRGGV